MIVLDASVVLDLILRPEPGGGVAERVLSSEAFLQAPHLLDLEVAQVVRRYWLARDLSAERAAEALADFRDMRIARHPHEPLLTRIWELRHNLTAYDAAYLALAEALDSPLLTRDSRLASVPGHTARVEVL